MNTFEFIRILKSEINKNSFGQNYRTNLLLREWFSIFVHARSYFWTHLHWPGEMQIYISHDIGNRRSRIKYDLRNCPSVGYPLRGEFIYCVYRGQYSLHRWNLVLVMKNRERVEKNREEISCSSLARTVTRNEFGWCEIWVKRSLNRYGYGSTNISEYMHIYTYIYLYNWIHILFYAYIRNMNERLIRLSSFRHVPYTQRNALIDYFLCVQCIHFYFMFSWGEWTCLEMQGWRGRKASRLVAGARQDRTRLFI